MKKTNLEKRVVTYLSSSARKWLLTESKKRGLNESAIIREILLEKIKEGDTQ